MKLQGLKVNFLGDSITEPAVDTVYHARLAQKYGFAAARNYGISGTRLAEQIGGDPENISFDRNFCLRAAAMDDDADLVIVFGGTNDFGHGNAPIGTMADRTPATFYGACHTLMRMLIEKYPTATIVFMTPLHRLNEDDPYADNRTEPGPVLRDYVNIIREVTAYYSLPLIDLWQTSGLQPRVDILRETYMPDGLHPNPAGHARLAERIGAFLEAL